MIDGLEADVVTLALAYDIDAVARSGPAAKDWQKRLPGNSSPLHLHHRVPGAQGQPEGDQGLGRSREAGSAGDHAEPEDLGRRRAGTTSPPGPTRSSSRAAPSRRRGRSSARSTRTCRCSTRARAARPSPSCSAASATCSSPGRTRRSCRSRSWGRTRSRSSSRRSASWPSRRWRWWTRSWTGRARAPWPRRTSSSSTRPRARRSRRATTTGRGSKRSPKKYAASFPKVNLVTIDELFGGWQKAQKTHFADGGVFDQIYAPK